MSESVPLLHWSDETLKNLESPTLGQPDHMHTRLFICLSSSFSFCFPLSTAAIFLSPPPLPAVSTSLFVCLTNFLEGYLRRIKLAAQSNGKLHWTFRLCSFNQQTAPSPLPFYKGLPCTLVLHKWKASHFHSSADTLCGGLSLLISLLSLSPSTLQPFCPPLRRLFIYYFLSLCHSIVNVDERLPMKEVEHLAEAQLAACISNLISTLF